MKYFVFVFALALPVLFLSGCGENTTEESVEASTFTIEETATPDQEVLPSDDNTPAQLLNNQAANDFFLEGNKLAAEGKYDEAIAVYNNASALVSGPEKVRVLTNKAAAFYHLARFEDAITVYDEIIEINPDSAENYSNKGAALSQLERYDEALQMYTKSLQKDPMNFAAFYNKACAHALMGDRDKAIGHLRRAFELNGDARSFATQDEDLKSLWDDPEFLEMVN